MQGWLLLRAPDWNPPTLPWGLCLPCWLLHLHWPRAAVSTPPYLGESEYSFVSVSQLLGSPDRSQLLSIPRDLGPETSTECTLL